MINTLYHFKFKNQIMNTSILHSAIDRTPYTYLIGWSHLNMWYYGRRTAKNCHPNDLWVKYFTSSDYVKEFRTINGEPDVIQIRQIFKSVKQCSRAEEKVTSKIYKYENWLNKQPANGKFDSTGLTTCGNKGGRVNVKDKNGTVTFVSVNDPKYLSGELVMYLKDTVAVVDTQGKKFRVPVDDPRYLNGELVGHTTGFMVAKDKLGTTYHVRTTDPRLQTGELSSHLSNMILVINTITNKKTRCLPSDPRLISGELVTYNPMDNADVILKMKMTKLSKYLNILQVSTYDEFVNKILKVHKGNISKTARELDLPWQVINSALKY